MQFVSEADSDLSSDGVLTDSTGDVVVKPCTQAEIDFYEISRAYHPDLAAHMPTYMGTVRLQNPEESIKTGPAIARSPQLSRAPTLPSQPASATIQEFPSLPLQSVISETTQTNEKGRENEPDSSIALKGKALETNTAIVLENIAAGFARPNILDIKLGARLWADDASPEKRARLDKVAAETTSSSLGFRIAGMRVWRGRPTGTVPPSERPRPGDTVAPVGGNGNESGAVGPPTMGVIHPANVDMSGSPTTLQVETEGLTDPEAGYQIYDKVYGRNFNATTVKTAFDEFFLPADYACDIPARRYVVEKCVRELAELQAKLEKMECRMYSASILCVYEGDNAALDAAVCEEHFSGSVSETAASTGDTARIQAGNSSAPDPSVPVAVSEPSHNASDNAEDAEDDAGPGEGEEDDDDDDEEEESTIEPPKVSALKLIDFAHAKWTLSLGPDENLLHGVRSVRQILEELLASTDADGPTSGA